jgi:hypothetical protein
MLGTRGIMGPKHAIPRFLIKGTNINDHGVVLNLSSKQTGSGHK